MQIIFAQTKADAEAALAEGAVPVECSFGHLGSVVDARFVMDHHGDLSHLEGVAIRAYRDHFGALRETFKAGTSKFVVTGAADADATFAIASLIGELPHPSRAEELTDAPPHVVAALTRDITELATLVNAMDTEPIGLRPEESADGCTIMLWNQLASGTHDASAFHSGVDRWRTLLTRPRPALLAAVKDEEALRVAKAREALVERISEHVTLVESETWGFDVWYADHSPLIVSFTPRGDITLGCRDRKTAEKLLGTGGLKTVFPKLSPEGWGGREAIGGSPRGLKMTRDQAVEAAKILASRVTA